MKRFSWKYMAGLVDGEGCIDMQGSTDKRDDTFYCRPRFRLSLSGEDGKALLEQCVANFGGHLEVKKNCGPWKQPYAWLLTGKGHMRPFLQNIVNHTVLKKEQIKFAIWWLDNVGGTKVAPIVRLTGVDLLKAMKRDPQRLSEQAIAEIKQLKRQSEQA